MSKTKSSCKTITYSITGKRSIVLFFIISAAIVFAALKIALINISSDLTVSDAKLSKSILLGESRGLIYDCNMRRLVENDYEYVCAVKPCAEALLQLRNVINDEEYSLAVQTVSKGDPLKVHPDIPVNNEFLFSEKIYKRYNNEQLAAHIIGYTDSSSDNGLVGLEYGYNSFLNLHRGSYRVRFFVDGSGRVMYGGKTDIINDNYNSCAGVVTSLDINLQKVVEQAMDIHSISKGAAVLLDVKSGAIKAMVSRPNFNPNRISDYINDENLALFNRALGAYPVGSVFKPLVAASALEQGIDPSNEYKCTGNISVGGVDFGCTKAHGEVNMATALVYSCNCYFIDLIEKIDCKSVVDLAASLGFGQKYEIALAVSAYSGNLPGEDELSTAASKSNFSFGQGVLTATPLQIVSLYSMIANNGKYYPPYLVEGFLDRNGNFTTEHTQYAPYTIVSEDTAQLIGAFLELAVRQGTGENAAVENIDVAGKTATAQSGDFSDGKERLVTWFAGFFPYESPQYALVIMCEDGISGSKDCAPVFSDIVKACSNINK